MKTKYIVFFIFISILFFSCLKKIKLTDRRDFAINNTDQIDYISIKNKTPKTVILSKKNNNWELQSGFPVRKEAINFLLETTQDMQIKRPVAVKEKENILERMSIQRTQIDFFSKDKKIKTIYVGGDTQDQLGTYMILENSSEPYVVYIPGFNGYLSSRFSCDEDTWKEKIIFDFQKHEIETVKINYKNPKNSFKIESKDTLSSEYFSNFQKISCEKFLKSHGDFNIEVVKKREPIFDINIKLKNGKKVNLKAFNKKSSLKGRSKDKKYDNDRFYGLFKNELILIQYQQFENILKNPKKIKEE